MARGSKEQFDGNVFVKPDQKRFWPLRIPVSHWQLRHFISHNGSDTIYYASGHEVYSINIVTKQRTLLCLLPFDARCTASGYGWICVGGEAKGHFATIKLDGSGDVDAALPIDAWRKRPASLKIERLGVEIVNSISIHRIQEEESHLDDIVAVVTNNDKTVRIYSLPLGKEVTVLHLSDPVNHATISPCGTLLVAVGDHNEVYFYKRVIKDDVPLIPKPHNRLTSASIDWEVLRTQDLYLHTQHSPKGYFTTAWSAAGDLIAIGSEGGYITIFDVATIKASPDIDPTITVISSSRPDYLPPLAGAVRTMIFSPAPWDLLIWSEDQGRICIADVRSGLYNKQVLSLEPNEESLERVIIDNAPLDGVTQNEIEHSLQEAMRNIEDMELEFLRRYRRNGSAIPAATEYLEARNRQHLQRFEATQQRLEANLRALRPVRTQGITGSQFVDDPRGLTADEQQILESLRTTRQREEAREAGRARGVTYTTADALASVRSSASSTPSAVSRNSTVEAVNRLELRDETMTEAEDLTLTRMNHISRQSSRPTSAHEERHRTVILPTPPGSQPSMSALAREAQLSPAPEAEDDRLAWDAILDATNLARGPLFESAGRVPTEPHSRTRMHREITELQSLSRRREHIHNVRMSLSTIRNGGLPSDGAAATLERFDNRPRIVPEIGTRTAGLAMSPDGSTLWAACEDGIFEFKMNQDERLFWPAAQLR